MSENNKFPLYFFPKDLGKVMDLMSELDKLPVWIEYIFKIKELLDIVSLIQTDRMSRDGYIKDLLRILKRFEGFSEWKRNLQLMLGERSYYSIDYEEIKQKVIVLIELENIFVLNPTKEEISIYNLKEVVKNWKYLLDFKQFGNFLLNERPIVCIRVKPVTYLQIFQNMLR